jgi:regulator of protease activity HflC (stomatin/prohibitin superfamily)
MKTEKEVKPMSGYPILLLTFIISALGIYGFATKNPIFVVISAITLLIMFIALFGLFFISPNRAIVLTLFGEYKGTVKENGFYWVNPFLNKKPITLRAKNFDSTQIKVNDKLGNPIMIGAIVVWRVQDTYKASFEVDNFENFVQVQTEAAIRHLAGVYPYDNIEEWEHEITLRSGVTEVNQALEKEVEERLKMAGIQVIEARISHLAYAQEIAGAMLKRQQAMAIIAARQKIVEGAVSMVEMAIRELSKKEVVHLDEERKAAMVSNLMVVLCSDKDTSPVINTGSIY